MKTIEKPAQMPDDALNSIASKELQARWQAGDWSWLVNTFPDPTAANISDELTRIQLAIAHCQMGNTHTLRQVIAGHTQNTKSWRQVLSALMSGYAASLAKCHLSIDEDENAFRIIRESVTFDGLQSSADTITPLKLAVQIEQLGLGPTYGIDFHSSSLQRKAATDLRAFFSCDTPNSPLQKRLVELLFNVISHVIDRQETNDLRDIAKSDKSDPFLSGKIMLSIASLLAHASDNNIITRILCKYVRKITTALIDAPIETWGVYFFLSAIHRLQELNILEDVFSYKELNRLRQKLHCNEFIDTKTYELINKPTNFYQVAYGISMFRFHLGWEDGAVKDALLQKMLSHIEKHCPTVGFADESAGNGRYDRYSVLLIAEIAHRLRESGLPLTKKIKTWLKHAADFVLMHANSEGIGFQYGRSIGPYGDSSTNEILSAAAWFGLLDESEKRTAYIYSTLSSERFLNFWWCNDSHSVNLWSAGRLTDKYRDRHRMLGETLSLLHHHLYTTEIWNQLGMHETVTESPSLQSETWLRDIPPTKYYALNTGKDEYGIFIYRKADKAFTLPLINGDQYHGKSFYLPIPYNHATIQGVPDKGFALLVPKITTQDGQELMPLGAFKDINIRHEDNLHIVSYKQNKFDIITEEKPRFIQGFKANTQYTFSNEFITRQDKISCSDRQNFDATIEFLSFFPVESAKDGTIIFTEGPIEKISFEGLNKIETKNIESNDRLGSNERTYSSLITAKANLKNSNGISVEWTAVFRD